MVILIKKDYKQKKCVKAANTSNKEVVYFDSVYSVGQHLDMMVGEIRLVCDGKLESVISRRNGCIYIFEYVEENLPVKYIRLSGSEKKRKLIEERGYIQWRDKIYDCKGCGKALLYGSQYHHQKNCKINIKRIKLLDDDIW